MTKFEEIGVGFQQNAETKNRAIKNYQNSCKICCERGLHIDCERCAIANVHRIVLESFEVLAANPVKGFTLTPNGVIAQQ